ncbi:MAG: AAA family ATPase [Gemmataceae bacterium]
MAILSQLVDDDDSGARRGGARPGRDSAGQPERGVRSAPDLLRLSDVVPAAVPWLWPGRIPLGRITVLSGRGGEGKSYLTCDLAARITTGAVWPDGGAAPAGSVLFICAEDDPADTIAPRLDAAGADRRRAHLLRAVRVTNAAGKETAVAFDLANVDMVGDSLDRLPDCNLVVIDPVGSYLGGRVDAHRDNEVRAVLAPLAALAAMREVAVLLVAHTRKGSGSFADDTVMGSRAFTALARCVWHLTADENDRTRKLLLPGKCNLAAPAPGLAFRITPGSSAVVGSSPRLEWEPDPLTGAHADDFLADRGPAAGRGPDPTARTAAADWLAELLCNGPVAAAEVRTEATAAGMKWETVRRAREALGIRPRKQSFGGGWVWALPDPARRCSSPARGPEGVQEGGNLNTFGNQKGSTT